jgi:sugar lactone lactonase YvrE/enterochelin esterase-like enzyme
MPTEIPYPRRPLLASLFALVLATLSGAAGQPPAEPDYPLGPDSQRQPGVPQGKVTQFQFADSKIFPGTVRDYWVYVPAQYDAAKPTPVMVFQDGGGFVKEDGPYRAPAVLDNLIHRKEIPAIIGVFVNPGVVPKVRDDAHPRYNRSFEYDTPSDRYAQFLLDELLPEIAKQYNLTTDGTGRGIAGASSGGIAAFTAAWERAEAVQRVISFVGSFTDLRGGNDYPSLVRKSEPRPIRVFLQDGKNDLDTYAGSWWQANQDLAAALRYAGYEFQTAWGDGSHNGRHGGQVLPDALRYIWQDYPKSPAKGTFPLGARDGRPTVMDILLPGEDWQLVSEGHQFTEGPAADAQGNVYFTDIPNNRIHRIDAGGKVSLFAENTGGANGLMFGPDGKLYAAQGKAKRVVAYDPATAKEEVIAEQIAANDLVVNHAGGIYVTEPDARRVWYISPAPQRKKRIVDFGIQRPNGVILTPDQSQLVVADTNGPNMFLFQIQKDGSLKYKQPYFALRVNPTDPDGGADGLTIDRDGRLYVASRAGLQVFDQTGKVNAILRKPQNAWLANACFGGKDRDTLYVACGDKVYKRKVKPRGVLSWQAPVLPPPPRL